ncbi:MAG: NlpC/P60 family protein [Thermodesulfobacteriota bacterium]
MSNPVKLPIPSWVSSYIGLPFREAGRERSTGLDCWGLVRLVLAEKLGLDLPSFEGVAYRKGCDMAALGETMREFRRCLHWAPVLQGQEECFDLIWLRTAGAPIHVGLVVAPGWMLHVEQGCDSVIESYTGLRWKRRILEILRPSSPLPLGEGQGEGE